jgi:hypothetical protein
MHHFLGIKPVPLRESRPHPRHGWSGINQHSIHIKQQRSTINPYHPQLRPRAPQQSGFFARAGFHQAYGCERFSANQWIGFRTDKN